MLNLKECLFSDYIYSQNPDGSYIFDKSNKLVLRSRNEVVDAIRFHIKSIYTGIVKKYNFSPYHNYCDDIALDRVLRKTSRDIFGGRRLEARAKNLKNIVPSDTIAELLQYDDYGLKVESINPYIHRQIAVLFYWLSILKPFSLQCSEDAFEKLGALAEFHNEAIAYLLIQGALKYYSSSLTIHKHPYFLRDFLYDLHYRKLSRSSLEIQLAGWIE